MRTDAPDPGRTVAVLGAGAVGADVAGAVAADAAAERVLLVDAKPERAEGVALDLQDALALGAPVTVAAARTAEAGYDEAARADLAILTAGKAGAPGETRLDLLEASAAIVRDAAGRLKRAGFAGILLVVSNPADVMAELALRESGLPPGRVIGSGTLLDSMRLRRLLAVHLGVAPAEVAANVIGEHGDSSVSVLSSASVGGVPLADLGCPDRRRIQTEVRARAARIIAGKGNTSRGIGAACARVARAVLRDERAVLTVAARLSGQYGAPAEARLFFGTPCTVGAKGILAVHGAGLDPDERADADASLAALREAVARL